MNWFTPVFDLLREPVDSRDVAPMHKSTTKVNGKDEQIGIFRNVCLLSQLSTPSQKSAKLLLVLASDLIIKLDLPKLFRTP